MNLSKDLISALEPVLVATLIGLVIQAFAAVRAYAEHLIVSRGLISDQAFEANADEVVAWAQQVFVKNEERISKSLDVMYTRYPGAPIELLKLTLEAAVQRLKIKQAAAGIVSVPPVPSTALASPAIVPQVIEEVPST